MHRRRSRTAAIVAAVTVCLTLGACSSVINGTPGADTGSAPGPTNGRTSTPPTSPPPSRAPAPNAQLPVKGLASGSCPNINATPLDAVCFDTIVQNSLSDVMDFWKTEYPKIANGQPLPPLAGGLYSVDGQQVAESGHASPPATDDKCIARDAGFIVDNGAFCPLDDSIAWDRNPDHLFAQLADHYGPFLVGLIFAHEFGHAIQYRLGIFNKDLPTIDTESEADCAAGAWAAWALAGNAPHFPDANQDTLDNALEGFLDGRDGTPNTPQDVSHGNGFDRLHAVADGIENGATFCYNSDYFNRTFTERPFYAKEPPQENTPLDQIVTTTSDNVFVDDLNRFWTTAAQSIGKTWKPVTIEEADHPPCESSGPSEFDYCPSTNTVYFSDAFAEVAYNSIPGVQIDSGTGNVTLVFNQPGDFALGLLFSIGWGLAVRAQFFGGSMDNQAALLAATCYSGAYAKNINVAPAQVTDQKITLSPGDLDEAVSSMLDQVPDTRAFGPRGTTGLERIQAFVKGYFGGLHGCS